MFDPAYIIHGILDASGPDAQKAELPIKDVDHLNEFLHGVPESCIEVFEIQPDGTKHYNLRDKCAFTAVEILLVTG